MFGRDSLVTLVLERERTGFAFPTADMLQAAAALFQQHERPAQTRGFQLVGGDLTRIRRDGSKLVNPDRRFKFGEGELPASDLAGGIYAERANGWGEGYSSQLVIGPGMVELRHVDLARRERAAGRAEGRQAVEYLRRDREHRRRRDLQSAQCYGPMFLAMTDPEIDDSIDLGAERVSKRGQVVRWSGGSQRRLIKTILQLDLAPLVAGERAPVMATLTLPGDWLAVVPNAAEAARKFDNFRRAYEHKWGAPAAAWIWKREFQRRGAPHWHLWLVPPVEDLWEFRAWLSAAWTKALEIADPGELAKSLAAGTNVSRADGLRARDPHRLANYFLKESGTAESKSYQNLPPWQWSGQSVGRYWGVLRIPKATVTVELDVHDWDRLWDLVAQRRGERTGWFRADDGMLLNHKTGQLVVEVPGGWVSVVSGADYAVELAATLMRQVLAPPDPD